MKNIAILSFTENGYCLARKIEQYLTQEKITNEVIFYEKTKKAQDFIDDIFLKVDAIIFVGAVGIATRMISKHINSKALDPAVIVIDELGNYVIPILSGHLGGGNFLGNILADFLHATPIITTATDINNKFAVDVWTRKHGCVIGNVSRIKDISSSILNNKTVGLFSDFKVHGNLPVGIIQEKTDGLDVGICISFDEEKSPFSITLNSIPKIITMGVGCRKDSDFSSFENFILETLNENHISLKAIEKMWSIDIKANENCFKLFSEKYDIPFQTSSKEELNEIKDVFTSSDFVKKITGVDNVCERSAVFGSNNSDRSCLILPKTSHNGFTVALATKKWECKF